MKIPSPATSRVLRAIEGASIREACVRLDLSPNGVHSHLRRARDAGWAETSGEASGWRLTRAGRAALRLAEKVEAA